MRLKENQLKIIKTLALKFFGKNAKVYLFGSRTDEHKKGGDIDIYIETASDDNIFERKIEMLIQLQKELGQRKIDLVVNSFRNNLPIYEVARKEGILL